MAKLWFAPPREGAAMPASGVPEGEGSGAPSDELPIRVLIVEDHQVVAQELTALINQQGDMKVVGEAGSVADTFTAASELGDVVLLDFRLPDGAGAEAAAAIREVRPEAKLIFLTREDTDAARLRPSSPGQAHSSTNRRPPPRWSRPFATWRAAGC